MITAADELHDSWHCPHGEQPETGECHISCIATGEGENGGREERGDDVHFSRGRGYGGRETALLCSNLVRSTRLDPQQVSQFAQTCSNTACFTHMGRHHLSARQGVAFHTYLSLPHPQFPPSPSHCLAPDCCCLPLLQNWLAGLPQLLSGCLNVPLPRRLRCLLLPVQVVQRPGRGEKQART